MADNKCMVDGVEYSYYSLIEGEARIGCAGATAIDKSTAGMLRIPSFLDGMKVVALDRRAFRDCSKITSVMIPEGLTHINDEVFGGCTSLKSIRLPLSLQRIAGKMFVGTEFWRSAAEGVVILDGWVLGVKGKCPEEVVLPEGVRGIVDEAFISCENLKSVKLPKSLKWIGGCAFENCTSLSAVVIPGCVERVGVDAFRGCTNLNDVKILLGVKVLATGAFEGCSSLMKVTIPDSVETIREAAFIGTAFWRSAAEGCVILDGWVLGAKGECPEKVVLPEGVRGIADEAFDCFAPDSDDKPKGKLKSVVIPGSVKSIGVRALGECKDLEEVVIMEGVKRIEEDAFIFCSALKSVIIPNSVEYIGPSAFGCCTKVKTITIPDCVKIIDETAFWGCEGAKFVRTPQE